jgi:S1-C subfamily serine protease
MRLQRLTLLAGFTLALVLSSSRPLDAEDQAAAVFRKARTYTVRIRTEIKDAFIEDETPGSFSGAGFLVDAGRGWVLTNAHVAGHSPSVVQVAFAGGEFHPARKIYVDSFSDVAILEVETADRKHPSAVLDCASNPQVGEAVGVFGHPLGLPFTGSRGIISGKTDQWFSDLIQIDATVDHGNSGGPVISLRDGRIVGIATLKSGDSKVDRLNFATPIQDACRILTLLKQGVAPDPPRLEFALLVDEDGHQSLRVGRTYNAERWPFQPGDEILSVAHGVGLATITELVSALRGVRGAVAVQVERDGRMVDVTCRPESRPSMVERQGVVIDGAVIAPVTYDDAALMVDPARLAVHSVEPGSRAETVDVQSMDFVESVDGRAVTDLDDLIKRLGSHRAGEPIHLVLARQTDDPHRWFDLQTRELPGDEIRVVGRDSRLLSGNEPHGN